MRFCFTLACFSLAAAPWLSAASPESAARAQRGPVVSVVRADSRSGRLVRVLKVEPRAVPGKAAASPSATVAEAMADQVAETAGRYQVDPLLVDSLIQVESNYNPVAVSPKGARGLMQLMPRTARHLDVKNSFDTLENLDGGVRYLKYLLTMFGDQDPRLALAAYNAGEGAVIRHGGVPPYPETIQYVSKVGRKYTAARRAAEARAEAARPPAPEHPPIEQYIDERGRLHLRTRPSP
jgi:soluble lytic murein transglycosylase-like protein